MHHVPHKHLPWFGHRANFTVPTKKALTSAMSQLFNQEQINAINDLLSPTKDLRHAYPKICFFFRTGIADWRFAPRLSLLSSEIYVISTLPTRLWARWTWNSCDFSDTTFMFSVFPGPEAVKIAIDESEKANAMDRLQARFIHAPPFCYAIIRIPTKALSQQTAKTLIELNGQRLGMTRDPLVTPERLSYLLLYKPQLAAHMPDVYATAIREMAEFYLSQSL